MTSPFFSLNIGASALRADQTLVDIANQNIANASTPGYSRQAADVKASLAYPIPTFNNGGIVGQLGSGVEIAQVTRARDAFIDYQLRGQLTSQGRWDARRDALKQVESLSNEPSSDGLSSLLTKYSQAWQEVANSPSDSAVRASLIEQGKSVADAFNNQSQQLFTQQRDLDQQVSLAVTDVNNYADQIAKINLQISQVETAGMRANDLRDQRDQLLNKLSQLVKINYTESSEGSVSVYVGNRQLVDRNVAYALQAVTPTGQKFAQVQWASDGAAVNLQDGRIQGLLESRDQLVQGQLDRLNTLAGRIIESVNSLHTAGVGLDGQTGVKFFDGTDAATMSVDPELLGADGTQHIAAARMTVTPATPPSTTATYDWAQGDSSNAVALGELANAVTQRDTSNDAAANVLRPGNVLSTSGTPATVMGVDLSSAPPATTFVLSGLTYDAASGTATLNTGSGSVTATVTAGSVAGSGTPPTLQAITLDAGSFKVTLQASASASISNVLANLNSTTFATQSARSTIGDEYSQQVAALGVDSSTAQSQSNSQQVLITQLTNQQQQTSGVSLDEETTNLIQYQHAYQAAARVISVVDQMLDTLINNTGVAGR
jgi:flagellar hook-associated protein 1